MEPYTDYHIIPCFSSPLYTEFINENVDFIIKYKNWEVCTNMLIMLLNSSLYM